MCRLFIIHPLSSPSPSASRWAQSGSALSAIVGQSNHEAAASTVWLVLAGFAAADAPGPADRA